MINDADLLTRYEILKQYWLTYVKDAKADDHTVEDLNSIGPILRKSGSLTQFVFYAGYHAFDLCIEAGSTEVVIQYGPVSV